MTQEEIKNKCEELGQKHGCKVHPLHFKDAASNEDVVGFIREPERHVKLRYMDKALTGSSTAGAEIVEAYLIREESDERILKDDVFFLGAVHALNKVITLAVDQLKGN